jgi:polysaccharide chain length determinant protein (PEP-CTERM system associated)
MHDALEFILELARSVSRFRWTAMLVAWIVCLIGWLVVLSLPDTYSAWARVHIDSSTPLKGIAPEPNLLAEVKTVNETLLDGPQLGEVARLAIPRYVTASHAQQQAIVAELRARLQIAANGDPTRNQPADLYTITYTGPDQRTAQRVVDQLLRLFVSSSVEVARRAAETVQKFLSQEIAEHDKKLEATEARLADFKRENAGLLPGVAGDYFSRLQEDKDQLQKLRSNLKALLQKRDELQKQLSRELAPPGDGGGASDTAKEIAAAKAHLDGLRRRFTDKHPDVLAAQQDLDELKKRQQDEIAGFRHGNQSAISELGKGAYSAYTEIQTHARLAEAAVTVAESQVEDQEAKVAEQQKMIDKAPQVEAEYAQLSRDYEAMRGERNALVERLNGVTLSRQAEAVAVRFKVVEPPTVTAAPVSPGRPRLILMVLLGGLAAGLAAAYIMSELRPVFTSADQLGEGTRLTVLGTVSIASPERYRARKRRALWAYSAVAAALVLIAVIMLLTQSATSQLIHGLMA